MPTNKTSIHDLRGTVMGDQTRNLSPTPEARVAMVIWGAEYANGAYGSMDFWDRLSLDRKYRCEIVVSELRKVL